MDNTCIDVDIDHRTDCEKTKKRVRRKLCDGTINVHEYQWSTERHVRNFDCEFKSAADKMAGTEKFAQVKTVQFGSSSVTITKTLTNAFDFIINRHKMCVLDRNQQSTLTTMDEQGTKLQSPILTINSVQYPRHIIQSYQSPHQTSQSFQSPRQASNFIQSPYQTIHSFQSPHQISQSFQSPRQTSHFIQSPNQSYPPIAAPS